MGHYRNNNIANVPITTRRLMAPNASKTECLLSMVVAPFSRWTNDSAAIMIEPLGDSLDLKSY